MGWGVHNRNNGQKRETKNKTKLKHTAARVEQSVVDAHNRHCKQWEWERNNALRSCNAGVVAETASGSSTSMQGLSSSNGDGYTVMDHMKDEWKSNRLEPSDPLRSRVPALQMLEDGRDAVASDMVAARSIQQYLIHGCVGRVVRLLPHASAGSGNLGMMTGPELFHMVRSGAT